MGTLDFVKRSDQLIRAILEHVELKQDNGPIPVPEIDGYTPVEVKHHVLLCKEAGYLLIEAGVRMGTMRVDKIYRLTWQGHEALNTYRG